MFILIHHRALGGFMLEVRPFSRRDKRFRAMLERNAGTHIDDICKTAEIIRSVRQDGQSALLPELGHYGNSEADASAFRINPEDFAAAKKQVSESFLTALSLARVNARKFHEHQRRKSSIADDNDGVILSHQVRALRRIGIYCGSSFSTLVAHVVPAQLAGVGSIAIAVAPCPDEDADGSIDPRILAAAHVLGIDEVYRLRGAHAVAAMAFGTDFLEKVDKIFGSDDNLAGVAKRLLADTIDVDHGLDRGDLAIIADSSGNARFVAGDLLAQAEIGDNGAMAALFTTDRLFGEAVRIEAERLIQRFPNADELRTKMESHGTIFICSSLDDAVRAVNDLAPARLSLRTSHNEACLSEVDNAGAVYMGQWSAEAAGGYFSGVNALLPTGGCARSRSGLRVGDFSREMPVVEFGPDRFMRTGRHQVILAEEEGLMALAETVRERLELLKLTVD